MSLRPAEIAPVPAATVQVAKAAFPKGCPAMRTRDELGAIYDDQMFAAAYPARGQPAHAPWRRALVTVLQLAEGLPDRQAKARAHSSASRMHAGRAAARPAAAGAGRVRHASADPPVLAFGVNQHLDRRPGARQAARCGAGAKGALRQVHVSPTHMMVADY